MVELEEVIDRIIERLEKEKFNFRYPQSEVGQGRFSGIDLAICIVKEEGKNETKL